MKEEKIVQPNVVPNNHYF